MPLASRTTHHVRGGQGTARPTNKVGRVTPCAPSGDACQSYDPPRSRRAGDCPPYQHGRVRHSPRHRMSGSVRAVLWPLASRTTHHVRGGQGTARPTHMVGRVTPCAPSEDACQSYDPPRSRRAGDCPPYQHGRVRHSVRAFWGCLPVVRPTTFAAGRGLPALPGSGSQCMRKIERRLSMNRGTSSQGRRKKEECRTRPCP